MRQRLLLAALLCLIANPMFAVTSEVRVLLDLDDDATTGCDVGTVDGTFAGAEGILITTVETTGATTAEVTGRATQTCVDPSTDTFGAPVPLAGGTYDVGVGLGENGSNVVETQVALSAFLADPERVRLGVVHEVGTDPRGADALLETAPGSGIPIVIVLASIVEIPTLGEWAALLLIGLLAVLALRTLRRRETIAFLLLAGVTVTAGGAWAACVLDGQIDDWTAGDRVATDATGDASTATDLVAFFAKEENGVLCFRIDTELLFDQPPTAVADAATVTEDDPATAIPVLANDTDPDGGPISIASVTQPANGTVVITGGGAGLTYAPNPNYCNAPPGSTLDTFTYTLAPGGSTATVTVTVTCVDDPPVAVNDAATVAEDSAATAVPVLANDTDPDGGAISIVSVTQPANGTVVITGGGAGLTYQPDPDSCNDGTPTDDFTYTLAPGGSTGTVSVTVTCTDDPPTAVADAATVAEDSGANTLDVQANDTDVDGGTNTISAVTQPANGTVVITNGGADLTYAPNGDYCNDPPGTTLDTFTYTLAPGGSSTTVTVTVTCVDDPPVAVNDAATVGEDSGANAIDVLANDTDSDAGPKLVQSVTQPANGTVAITGGGTGLTYAPNADYCNGGIPVDIFTYALNGGSVATVSVTVTCVNDGPVIDLDADDDKGTAGNDFAVTFTEGDPATLIVDPDDPNGATITDVDSTTLATLTVTLTNLLDVGAETLSADTTGTSITASYVPATGVLTLTGPDTIANFTTVLRKVRYRNTSPAPDTTDRVIQFVANDGTDDGNTAVSTVTISAVDTNPTAVDDAATVDEDSLANAIDALANDTDPDGGAMSITSVTQPTNGTVVITGGGTGVSYTPNANYCNTPPGTLLDTFTYTLSPGGSTATVSVTVTCVDDNPTAVADAATVNEDSGANAIGVLANDTDPDGGPISVASVTQPTNGTVVITGGGTGLTYQPNPNYCNTPPGTTLDTFTYTLTPGGSSTSVTVTVTCVDDNPVAVADAATVVEDSGANAIDVLGNDTDVDSGPISITSVTQPAGGTVVITGGGTGLTYQPNPNYCNNPPGTTLDTFTYTLTPGGSSTTVTMTVTCVDDPPTAVADAATVNEDSGANAIPVLANDTDIDSGPISIASVTQPAGGTVVITGGGTGLTYAPAANFCNDGSPVDTFTYTLTPGGSSTTVSMTVICINDPPLAGADAFDFVGNTELRVDHGAAATPHVLETTTGGTGVLENDSDPVEGDPISIVGLTVGACVDLSAPFDCSDPAVGRVQMDADGSFSFQPAPGDAGATEQFQYTLSDGTDTVLGTVTLTRFERVWYVKNDAPAAGDGTSDQPFDAITAANLNDNDGDGDLTDDLDAANDWIFVYFGDGTDSDLSGGLFLENGQHLIGEHAGLSIPVDLNGNGSPTVLVAAAPGNRPLMDDNVADGFNGGVLALNTIPAEVVGMNLAGDVYAMTWFTSNTFGGSGTFGIRDNVVRSAGVDGVKVFLSGSGATRLGLSNNTVTASGIGVEISETGAGALTITAFDDNVVSGNTGGSGIVISNAIFDATPGGGFDLVAGGATAIGASGNGVGGTGLLMTNISGDLQFTDLDVFADGGAGLSIGGTGASNLAGGTGLRFRVGAGVGIAVASGGPAVSLSNLTADLQLATVTSTNSTTTGISLDGVTDGGGINAIVTAGGGSAITLPAGATGPAFRVNGGNAQVTYGGTITNNATAARAVSITSWSGDDASDDLVLSGAIDENGAGILLNGNGGSRAITFSGGLDIDTTGSAAEGFAATSNTNTLGVNVTGSTNDIASISATALRVTSTPIGSSNLNFRRIDSGNNTAATDPLNGIVLSNTGTLGGLKVTGTGTAGSGGTIQRTTGDGIALTSTSHVELSNIVVTTAGEDGIDGTSVNNFSLTGSSVTNNGNAANEEGISFSNLSGTVSLTNVTATGNAYNNLRIDNTAGTISSLSISGGSYSNNQAVIGNHGILIEPRGSSQVTTATISGATISGNEVMGIQVATADTASVASFTVTGNTIQNNELGIDFSKAQTSSLTFAITNNLAMTGQNSHGINLFTAVGAGTTGNFRGRIENNTIGNAAVDGSGSAIGNCIRVNINGDANADVAISGNTIRECPNGRGIEVIGRNGTGGLDVTITNNNVDHVNTTFNPGTSDFPLAAILVQSNCAAICNTVRSDVTNNTVPAGSSFDFSTGYITLVESSTSTLQLVDTAPASADCAAQLTSANTGSVGVVGGCALIAGPIDTPP